MDSKINGEPCTPYSSAHKVSLTGRSCNLRRAASMHPSLCLDQERRVRIRLYICTVQFVHQRRNCSTYNAMLNSTYSGSILRGFYSGNHILQDNYQFPQIKPWQQPKVDWWHLRFPFHLKGPKLAIVEFIVIDSHFDFLNSSWNLSGIRPNLLAPPRSCGT